MAEKKKKDSNDQNDSPDAEELKEKLEEKISNYDKLLERLKEERDQLEETVKNDYRDARRYVRSHPEEGVLIAFAGGIVLGILIGKLTN